MGFSCCTVDWAPRLRSKSHPGAHQGGRTHVTLSGKGRGTWQSCLACLDTAVTLGKVEGPGLENKSYWEYRAPGSPLIELDLVPKTR